VLYRRDVGTGKQRIGTSEQLAVSDTHRGRKHSAEWTHQEMLTQKIVKEAMVTESDQRRLSIVLSVAIRYQA
jgi:hypothetical protein